MKTRPNFGLDSHITPRHHCWAQVFGCQAEPEYALVVCVLRRPTKSERALKSVQRHSCAKHLSLFQAPFHGLPVRVDVHNLNPVTE